LEGVFSSFREFHRSLAANWIKKEDAAQAEDLSEPAYC